VVDGHHLENRRSTISQQQFDQSPQNLAGWHISTLSTLSAIKISNFLKSKMADGRHLESRKISAKIWPITTKFGTVMHFYPCHSALTLLVGCQEEHPACKKIRVMKCWHSYLSRARCRWFAYDTADASAIPSSFASLKSRLLEPFWSWLTQVVLEKEVVKWVSVLPIGHQNFKLLNIQDGRWLPS